MTKAPRIVTIFVTTTITVVFWVFLVVYEIVSSKPTVQVPEELLKPIDPTLNVQVLGKIPERIYFEEGTTNPLSGPQVPDQPDVEDTDESTNEAVDSTTAVDAKETEQSEPSNDTSSNQSP